MNRWHTGSLPGTATILIRRHDGRNFVALLNARVSPSEDSLRSDVDQLLHRAANAVQDWPTHNLFDELAEPKSAAAADPADAPVVAP